jgi:hypothetical protein
MENMGRFVVWDWNEYQFMISSLHPFATERVSGMVSVSNGELVLVGIYDADGNICTVAVHNREMIPELSKRLKNMGYVDLYPPVIEKMLGIVRFANDADGKLTVTIPEEETTVEVTVTATLGEVTKTKTFTVSLSKAPITIPEALALADGSSVLVSGTVTKINTAWSDQYKNISVTIADADGNELYLYRLATKVVVGDVITVKGEMATYNNARQVAAGATAEITDPAPVEVTIPEALAFLNFFASVTLSFTAALSGILSIYII